MTKGFPIVVAPVALAWLWQGGDRRGAIRAAGALAVTLGVIGAGWLALSPEGALDSLEYQLDRPVQLESSPGSVLFLVGALGGEQPAVVASHGAAGLAHPLDGPIGLAFTALLIVAVAALVVGAAVATCRSTVAARARGRGAADHSGRSRTARATDPATDRALVLGALAAVTAFAAFGRVLSPQYLVWAVPLLALSVAWGMRTLAALAAAACALTLAEFPSRYLDLVAGEPLAVGITVARNAALLAAVVVAGAALWRLARSPREEAARGHALTSGGGAPARSIEPAHPVQPR